eukprot:12927358-Prorocentrum_lima.AAC.1
MLTWTYQVLILDMVWEFAPPGGQCELQGLTKYVREPGVASTAAEALNMLRSWRAAQRRGQC